MALRGFLQRRHHVRELLIRVVHLQHAESQLLRRRIRQRRLALASVDQKRGALRGIVDPVVIFESICRFFDTLRRPVHQLEAPQPVRQLGRGIRVVAPPRRTRADETKRVETQRFIPALPLNSLHHTHRQLGYHGLDRFAGL